MRRGERESGRFNGLRDEETEGLRDEENVWESEVLYLREKLCVTPCLTILHQMSDNKMQMKLSELLIDLS